MHKRVNATKGELLCTCPDDRLCATCYAKKLKPRISVQQPRKGSIPIKVEHFTEKQGRNVKIRDSLSSISTWYKERRESRDLKIQQEKEREFKAYQKQLEDLKKAQKRYEKEKEEEEKREQLKAYQKQLEELKKAQKRYEKEKEEAEQRKVWEQRRLTLDRLESSKSERYERLKREREKEVLEQLQEQEKYLLRAEADSVFNYNGLRKDKKKHKTAESNDNGLTKDKKKHKTAESKKVYVNKYNHRETWSDRFSHWFYRACCQFYCYLSCVLTVLFVLIYVI